MDERSDNFFNSFNFFIFVAKITIYNEKPNIPANYLPMKDKSINFAEEKNENGRD